MRAIIFSDPHGDIEGLKRAINYYKKPEYRFGLGDYEVEYYILDALGVTGVRGNSYFDPNWDYNFIYEINGFRILFTHGHRFSVKSGLYTLSLYCEKNNVDICFYGHTHEARIDSDRGRYYINPGSLGMPFYPAYPTLAYMEIDGNHANIKIVDSVDFSVYDEVDIYK